MSRLSGSATTNPITTARIKTLATIKSSVQAIIDKVNAKIMLASDIPIRQSEYKEFLPILGTDGTLPTLLQSANMPPSLSSLFPASLGDISGAAIAQYLFNNYAETFFKGLSWDMSYTSERSLDIANAKTAFANAAKSALDASGGNVDAAGSGDTAYGAAANTEYRGNFANQTGAGAGTGTGATGSTITAGPPARFDWKERSIAICDAVQKRGYNPGDFGCVADINSVGPNFSWRGYSKMVCSRIATIYDTGAPEACGCPPVSWAGWRS
jgi:hypothetical protein